MATLALPAPAPYPVRLDVEYAERQSRWQALFRVILVLPALLVVLLLAYPLYLTIFASWVVVLIRGRHPTWMFAFIIGILRTMTRVYAYFFLLTDAYVVFEGAHPLSLDIDYPQRVSRWQLVIWKYITSVPHALALQLMYVAGLAISFVGWIAIIFGGSYPKGLHAFATGVLRWQVRVAAYMLSLTDVFPPYSIDVDAGPGSRRSLIISAVAGVLIVAAMTGGIVALVLAGPRNEVTVRASYQQLAEGSVVPGEYAVFFESGVAVDLSNASDPADPFAGFIVADEGERLLMFEMQIINGSERDLTVYRHDYNLVDSDGGRNTPIAVVVDNHRAPREIAEGDLGIIQIVFEIEAPGPPRALKYGPGSTDRFGDGANRHQTIVYEFR